MAPVTISLGVIEAGLADATDAGAFGTDLLAAVRQVLILSGNSSAWNEVGERVDVVLDDGGGMDEILDIVRDYVHLIE